MIERAPSQETALAMSTPLISICLPNLNTFPFLEERLETILAQTMTDWQLIICDSYSDDGSWEFFQKFKKDPRVRLFQAPRKGPPACWNYCLEHATGEYLYIATSDDTMSPDCLETLLTPLEANETLNLAICDFDRIDERGRILPERHRPLTFIEDWTAKRCIRHGAAEFLLHASFGPTWVTMTTVLFRRTILHKTGLFPTQLGPVGDTAWAMRASLASDTAYVPGRLATWRERKGQASHPIVSREDFRQMLNCVRSVSRDPTIEVPSYWKEVRGWRSQIPAVWYREYCNSFSLYRDKARSNLKGFLGDLLSALISEPNFVMGQFRRGFRRPGSQQSGHF